MGAVELDRKTVEAAPEAPTPDQTLQPRSGPPDQPAPPAKP
jgi:hypothetical protein